MLNLTTTRLLAAGILLVATALPVIAQDTARIQFTLPFEQALAKAKADKKLLFMKPIYGGVDEIGAKDYCRGSW